VVRARAVDVVVHKNVQLSHIIVSNILYSDHLPVVFYLLDHISLFSTCWIILVRNLLEHVEKFTDWEQFKSLDPELTSPRIQVTVGEEADRVAHNFTASISSVYRLSTSRITPPDLNKHLHSLESLQKCNWRFQQIIWQLIVSPKSSEE
jgi:hypothetical protein